MSGKRIAILGSTGSIGRQAMEFIASQPALRVVALAAGNNWRLLAEQARACRPDWVAIADPAAAKPLADAMGADAVGGGPTVFAGPDAMTRLVREAGPDVLLSGIVGSAGLAPTLAGIECGATLAIANKETLVMAGAIVMPAARAKQLPVLPVDSEHSAIFQCLFAGRRDEVRHVTITGSGGALRDWEPDRVEAATVQDALNHPTWQMGRKITIDSATLMNKALEMIEAHWLFDLPAERIEVVIHPESIIHGLVEFCDGSVVAQMARPDMTLPIAYALTYPQRSARPTPSLDMAALGRLTFRPLSERFRRSVELGYEVIRRGGLSGAVVNAANEAAVEAFLAGRLRFGQIVPLVEDILNKSPQKADITLSDLLQADQWARAQVAEMVEKATSHKPQATR
ncbi:MAG: 1-deoxy-D-xylulose-5-phosphate reductoisomerase [Phycisphaerae bacterium]|nr:1-deoxy-D-xylulose-5-phosphate reductoisomerase [Phycisphaerae bacterium]